MEEQKNVFSRVDVPEDLKKLEQSELEPLCNEIRETLIQSLSKSGGHLASNLGTVELAVAIHRVFDSPIDQIIWDVGHQAYAHKLLTGRKNRFSTLRQKGGLSGFPNPKESEHDPFVVGHSSTSLAAAFGLARAKSISGEDGHVIAVIGDGAAGGGLFYEGLNNIGRYPDRLIVVLNDNKVSISKNKGGFAKYLSEIRVRPKYFKMKDRIDRFIAHIPLIGKWLRRRLVRSKSMLKYALYHTTWFEEFGFSYLGPVDGHDVNSLCDVLVRAKRLNKPVFIHVDTVKGKGYKFAEENPGAYHGVKPFDPLVGNVSNKTSDGFSEAFGEYMVELGEKDEKICAICPAMKYATGLDKFASKYPRRFIDVGIAEPLAVTCASGMAKNGLIPVVAIYSTFLQRAYDQILHDAAIDNQHIILAVDRAGIVGEDGETHQGIFDVPFLSSIPNVTIYSPLSVEEMKLCLNKAIYNDKGVVAVRYPRGKEEILPEKYNEISIESSIYRSDEKKNKTLVVTYGRIYAECVKALQLCENEGNGFDILRLVRLSFEDNIVSQIMSYDNILFVEESSQRGSMSEMLGNILVQKGYKGRYRCQTLGNGFVAHQSIAQAFVEYGIDHKNIAKLVKE